MLDKIGGVVFDVATSLVGIEGGEALAGKLVAEFLMVVVPESAQDELDTVLEAASKHFAPDG